MTKQETFDLLKLIHESYPSFQISQAIIDEWSKKFKYASFEGMKKKLAEIVAEAKLPPRAVDFMLVPPAGTYPTPEETKSYLYLPYKPASESSIRESRKIISKILGILR
ncbi:hypothetical protein [Pseudoneobacillus sp. C159]